MGSKNGIMKLAAKRCGVSLDEYTERTAKGEKWCTLCKEWHARTEFGKDSSRADGLTAQCSSGRFAFARQRYNPKPRPKAGTRRFAEARDGDKAQARARVNYLRRMGLIADPNALSCTDCGHLGSGVRHEYDHHLGYAAAHHEAIEPVCARCHHRREKIRALEGGSGP